MARTPEGALLTERHRRLQLTLSVAAVRDLFTLWGTVDPLRLNDTLFPFVQAGTVVVRAGRRASAAAASRYYVDFRRLEGARGQVVLTLPPLPEAGVVEGSLRGAALKGVVTARQAGRTPEVSARNGFVKLAGSATGLVLGGGRETLTGAIKADPEAQGWQRVTDPSPCAFCRMIASRGLHSKDAGEVEFKAHGHCGCTVEPWFEGSRPLPANEQFRQEWDAATQGLGGDEALNAYRRSLTSQE